MKSSISRYQVSARELFLITSIVAVVIFGTMASRESFRTKKRLLALIPNCEIRIYNPQPENRYALGGRFQHTGVIRFPVDATIPEKLEVRSFLQDPVSSERFAELTGIIGRQADAGVFFTVEIPPPNQLPTRPKAPGTYICVIEAFNGDARIAMAATPMTFVPSP